MASFLEAIAAGDLGIFLNNQDFVAVQNMRERFRQETTYRGSFGSDTPTIRTVRPADENTLSFSFLLLKSGVARGLNSYQFLRQLADFEIQTKKGSIVETYRGCNWSDIDIDSGLDQVLVNVDISFPGFLNE
ncbi:MAG TPA: hypothetical protein VJQ25_08670 [Nitrospira sp.]|nr:hypothetical protein [Nitrospira sp.]